MTILVASVTRRKRVSANPASLWMATGMVILMSIYVAREFAAWRGWTAGQLHTLRYITFGPGLVALGFLAVSLVMRTRLGGIRSWRDQGRHGGLRPAGSEPPPGVPEDVIELVRQGKKIQAIKRYREQVGDIGLKEAKDVIDQI